MSNFKFACPSCKQRIGATEEYIGQQITCPACQATIVVPGTPPNAGGPSNASAPPARGKLGVSALSSPQEHSAPAAGLTSVGVAAFQTHLVAKEKKSYVGLISGIAAALVIGIFVLTSHHWIVKKYKDVSGITAEEAATNVPPPPPPPPELTVDEIWQKVAETYKGLPNMSVTGKFASVIDYSKVNTSMGNGPVTIPGDLTLKATRPGNFRIDLSISRGGSNTVLTGWTAGSGSFVQQGTEQRFPEASPEAVMDYFARGYGVGPGDVIRFFVDDAHGTLPTAATDWSRTNDDKLNNESNYVLVGTVRLQNARVWVSRRTFLITQTQVDLDGESSVNAMDDNQLKTVLMTLYGVKQVTTVQIKAARQMAKLKGTVTDTYQTFDTNTPIQLAALEPPKPTVSTPAAAAAAPANAADQGGGNMGGGGGGGGRGGGGKRR
jgi:hypothetical protein